VCGDRSSASFGRHSHRHKRNDSTARRIRWTDDLPQLVHALRVGRVRIGALRKEIWRGGAESNAHSSLRLSACKGMSVPSSVPCKWGATATET